MSLAVCVLSYNHPEITAKCVKSVLRFYPAEAVYLTHNGSSEKNKNELEKNFPEIHHISIEQNRGYSGGANFALHHIFQKYDWCFFITNDCELTQVGSTPKKAALIAPQIHFRKIGRIDSVGGQFFANRGHLRHLKSVEEFRSIPQGQCYIPGTAFLMHKDIFENTMGFDESFHTYWEDVDLSLRAHKLGHELNYDTHFQVIHSVGKTCHKEPYYTTYLFHRNRARVSRKCTPWSDNFGLTRSQLEFNLLVDFCLYSSRFIRQKKWDRAQNLLRAYYGD